MMECKKALASPGVDGDVTRATEWLRKHGSAKVLSKVAGREALEGLVGIKVNGTGTGLNVASVVRVSSETDFAARSDALSSFVQEVADAAAFAYADDGATTASSSSTTTTTVEDVPGFLRGSKTTAPDGTVTSLEDRLGDAILAIRENLTVDSITILRASDPHSVFGGYVHGRASPTSTCGSAASIVELVPIVGVGGGGATVDGGGASEAARRLAMHVVAARPSYLDASSVPADVVEKEREILAEKADGGGGKTTRPPDIVEKIVSGQMRKFYEGACLTEQAHMVEEGGPKVSKALADLGLEVRSFVLVGMGK